jgi:hypothetical protein
MDGQMVTLLMLSWILASRIDTKKQLGCRTGFSSKRSSLTVGSRSSIGRSCRRSSSIRCLCQRRSTLAFSRYVIYSGRSQFHFCDLSGGRDLEKLKPGIRSKVISRCLTLKGPVKRSHYLLSPFRRCHIRVVEHGYESFPLIDLPVSPRTG